MSESNECEFEQVIDAFEADVPEEIVHIIQDEEEEDISRVSRTKAKSSDQSNTDMVIMVPPLLTASRDQERISISIDEIKRRVEAPEKLCATNLLSLLHLSKPRTPDLKETLSQYGLEKISKRSSIVSSFSKLSETETSHLAEDFYFLASRSLKTKEIGQQIADANGGWDQFKQEADQVKTLLDQIVGEVETKDTNLNLATHGFSPLIIKSTIDIISEILTPES